MIQQIRTCTYKRTKTIVKAFEGYSTPLFFVNHLRFNPTFL